MDLYAPTWVPEWWPLPWPKKHRFLRTVEISDVTENPADGTLNVRMVCE